MYEMIETPAYKTRSRGRRISVSDATGWLAAIMMVAALYAVFVYVPTEKQMGVVQRIFYFHLPSAFTAFLAFFVVFVASITYLLGRKAYWDMVALSAAEIGVVFTTVTLITGSIWAKPTWNTWWTWDPRLTTALVLWLIYVAYLMVRSAIEDPAQKARLAAVFGIAGFVDVPIVFMSIRWWRTIHPVVINGLTFEMDKTMVYTLVVSALAFVLLFFYLLRLRVSLEQMRDEVARLRGNLDY